MFIDLLVFGVLAHLPHVGINHVDRRGNILNNCVEDLCLELI
jgi:hypothetical protein